MPSSIKKILDMDYFFGVSPTLSLQIEQSTHRRSRMHEWAEERDDAVQAHWFLYRSSRLVKEAVALLLFL